MIRKIMGTVLIVAGLAIVLVSYGIGVEALLKMVAGGIVLIAGVACFGSRQLGDSIADFLKKIV